LAGRFELACDIIIADREAPLGDAHLRKNLLPSSECEPADYHHNDQAPSITFESFALADPILIKFARFQPDTSWSLVTRGRRTLSNMTIARLSVLSGNTRFGGLQLSRICYGVSSGLVTSLIQLHYLGLYLRASNRGIFLG
jgi:hypothetical protein